MKDFIPIIKQALAEDQACFDVTSSSLIPAKARITGHFIAKADGILCGTGIVKEVFTLIDKSCRFTSTVKDGGRIRKGQVFAIIEGPARAVLAGERTALNFIQHLSGVATLTNAYVQLTAGTKAKILDTRKTLPGMRHLQKYAVTCGGGVNHRMDLKEMALIKDNHLQAISDVTKSVASMRRSHPGLKVEMECENIDQVREALDARVNIIMLDNMTIPLMRTAIKMIRDYSRLHRLPKPDVEISGGVNMKTVRPFAKLGVERISVGALTHSVTALDISLELLPLKGLR